jgi:threonyl-tRNA synthetase
VDKKLSGALAAEINGNIVDLDAEILDTDTVRIITKDDAYYALPILRRSAAYILAYAIKQSNCNAQLVACDCDENSFWCDIKISQTFAIDHLPELENKMREILADTIPFRKERMSCKEAAQLFRSKNDTWIAKKIENSNESTVVIQRIRDFSSLCGGVLLPNTSFIKHDAFKLTSVSGVHSSNCESGEYLQRIYGTAWFSKEDMEQYFQILEEASKRDHRKLGPQLDIFYLDERAAGSVFWLNNGHVLFQTIKDFIAKVIKKYGYCQVQTPQLLSQTLWETSGHWDKFRENMFIVNDGDKAMAIKPMNCPGHILLYDNGPVKGYRDLPIRMAEFGTCHRNEPSGALHGIMRLRAFTQDDGHVFCTEDQIISETQIILESLQDVCSRFGFDDITVKFSDRPSRRAGSDAVWDKAESAILEATRVFGLNYTINRGEGAFYGPKLEFVLKDCLGREWQCGTVQVDFVLPERFGLYYIDHDGQKKKPVLLHRALVGSIERFVGILIEHYSGKFPFWLAPIQVIVANVSQKSAEYARQVHDLLNDFNFRSALDLSNEKITYKIRYWSSKKVPVIFVIGEQEVMDSTVSLRRLGNSNTEKVQLSRIAEYLREPCV